MRRYNLQQGEPRQILEELLQAPALGGLKETHGRGCFPKKPAMGFDHLVEHSQQEAAQSRSDHQRAEARLGIAVVRGGGSVLEGGNGGGHQLHRQGGNERTGPKGRQDGDVKGPWVGSQSHQGTQRE